MAGTLPVGEKNYGSRSLHYTAVTGGSFIATLWQVDYMDSIKNKQLTYLYCSLIMLMGWPLIAGLVSFAQAQQSNSPADALTGNWVVRIPNPDGTSRLTYLNLKQ